MEIIELASGERKSVIITETLKSDLKNLTEERFFFNWRTLEDSPIVYKLQLKEKEGILGVMGLIHFPDEARVEIKLITSSRENIGKKKKYEGIVGCLIGYACQLSLMKYGEMACVSLVPKTEIRRHYMEKYGMEDAGWQLFLDGWRLLNIVKKYVLCM
ncbi:N-acetyltransferase [Chitinophaga varians]|uniref:N-acetyltransferase n=1 Tax=Chitinophaga varians TaxID=2202339 RepID=UPI00165ED370|nr:N-acetyltransferase [Chitinophaga varians]MBC9912608.1 N-acetyltransferase [Chitinophaga varians]